MKKIFAIAIICLSLVVGNFAFQTEASADTNSGVQGIIRPMFTYVNQFSNSFYIDDYGLATLYSFISASSGDMESISIYLEKYNNGTWSPVNNWYKSQYTRTLSFGVEYNVTSNAQYRMRSTGCVYIGGRLVEMVTYISQVITY